MSQPDRLPRKTVRGGGCGSTHIGSKVDTRTMSDWPNVGGFAEDIPDNFS